MNTDDATTLAKLFDRYVIDGADAAHDASVNAYLRATPVVALSIASSVIGPRRLESGSAIGSASVYRIATLADGTTWLAVRRRVGWVAVYSSARLARVVA